MKKRQKEAILISFFREKEKYEKIADYIIHLIRDDHSSPKESIHTITYRIKDTSRLIEKIDEENRNLGEAVKPITTKNLYERVEDILGIRFICLRLADIKKVEAYLELLDEEKILRFRRRPEHKRSFILPVDQGESIPESLDLRYSGYSSIHFQVELSENSDAPDELKGISVEFQLRTILEEAWGEIDHKHRYVHNRIGEELPDYIHTGFYNLSAYLQVAALQAEHLCRQVEDYQQARIQEKKTSALRPGNGKTVSSEIRKDVEKEVILQAAFKTFLKEIFGFKLTNRTTVYILKRLDDRGGDDPPQAALKSIVTDSRLQEFHALFRKFLQREAFVDKKKRDIDAINALNFAIADETHGHNVAQEGLRAVLKWRKNC